MSVLTRTQAAERSAALTVHTQAVDIDLSRADDRDSADYPVVARIDLTTKTSTLMIDLAGEVTAVTLDDDPVEYRSDDHHVYVSGVKPGRHTITVAARCHYSRTGQGLHRYFDPVDGRVYCYTHFEPMDAHVAWPCFDQPDIKPRWTFTITGPSHWHLRNNQPEAKVESIDEITVRAHFCETPPLSAYLTAIIAGEYAIVEREPWRGRAGGVDVEIPLTYMCRESLAPDMDVEDMDEVTRAGLDFFHDRYDFAYPWGKYDQVFVPEYNIGAMENPGLVTFNEHAIHRGGPTRAQQHTLASTVLHEMCHMWFGDLVTPRWWDDLWLKESFADHEGTQALAEATRYTSAWAAFTLARASWAHDADLLPSTHPIMADIVDVEAAKQNFDGISYAKGACVLRQLVTWVGPDIFVSAMREYFRDHAFGTATFNDFLETLARARGVTPEGELTTAEWARRWLATSGPSLLHDQGTTVVQETSHCNPELDRPHVFTVDGADGETETVRLSGREATVGSPQPRLLNAGGETFALTRLTEQSYRWLLADMSTLARPESRAIAWLSLDDGLRAGWVSAPAVLHRGIDLVLEADEECRPAATGVLARALAACPPPTFTDYVRPFESDLDRALTDADAATMASLLPLAVATATLGESSPQHIDTLRGCLKRPEATPTMRWQAMAALAAVGEYDAADIESYRRDHDSTGEGRIGALKATLVRPDAAPEAARRLWEDTEVTNEELGAIAWAWQGARAHTSFDAATYIERIVPAWQSRPLHMALRLAAGAFPSRAWVSEDGEDVLALLDEWRARTDMPHALARMVDERRALLRERLERQRETLALRNTPA